MLWFFGPQWKRERISPDGVLWSTQCTVVSYEESSDTIFHKVIDPQISINAIGYRTSEVYHVNYESKSAEPYFVVNKDHLPPFWECTVSIFSSASISLLYINCDVPCMFHPFKSLMSTNTFAPLLSIKKTTRKEEQTSPLTPSLKRNGTNSSPPQNSPRKTAKWL